MGLPSQIQRQLEAAEQLQKQVYEPPAPETTEETGDAAPNESESQAPAVTQEPVAPAAEPKNDEYAQLEQRYRSLQGMWQGMNARLAKAEEANAELLKKLDEATSKLSAAAPATAAPKTSQLVTEQDAEAFGTDLIDLARRVAKEQFGEREQQLLGKIDKLEQLLAAQDQRLGSVAETQVATAQERFYAALDTALPTWEQIQATPECQTWLKSRVPGTRATWNDALVASAEEHDSARALEVFSTFLAAHPTLDPRRQKPAPEQSRKAEQLQRQVAPSKSGAATATPEGKKVYSAAEWSREMDRVVALGKARQYDEAAAIENELNAALAEGRVTP